MSTPLSEQLALFDLGPSIDPLREEEDDLMSYQRAENTGKAYAYWWSRFTEWSAEYRRETLPATPETVRYFVSWCIREGMSVATVRLALVAITHEHRRVNHSSPVDDSVRLLVRNAKKKLKRKSNAKTPLTPELLMRICKGLIKQGSNRALRDRVAIVIGFASSWRRRELAAVNLQDVTWLREGKCFRLFLAKEKTDQEANGRSILVSAGDNEETCPVRTLRAWLKVRGTEPGPLFCAVAGSNDKARPHASIGGEAIAHILKEALKAIGEDATTYSAHSMRAGHITVAAENGVPLPAIQQRSGHKKLETLFKYIRPVQDSRVDTMAGVL